MTLRARYCWALFVWSSRLLYRGPIILHDIEHSFVRLMNHFKFFLFINCDIYSYFDLSQILHIFQESLHQEIKCFILYQFLYLTTFALSYTNFWVAAHLHVSRFVKGEDIRFAFILVLCRATLNSVSEIKISVEKQKSSSFKYPVDNFIILKKCCRAVGNQFWEL